MDWEFITEEILELLESNSLTTSNVVELEKIVDSFVKKLKKKRLDEQSLTSDLNSELDFDLDEIDIFS